MEKPVPMSASVPCSSVAFAQLGQDLLRAGISVRFRARGVSMSPLVRDGDIVLVRPTGAREVRVGDVVILRAEPEHLIVHRIVRRHLRAEGTVVTVQGDQVSVPDGVFPAAQLLGRVVEIERDGRQIEVGRPMMRVLGRLAAYRSRCKLVRGRSSRVVRAMLKRLPGLAKYVA